jgi:hypothetical protein
VRYNLKFVNRLAAAVVFAFATLVSAEVPRGPIMGGGIMSPPANVRPPGLEKFPAICSSPTSSATL